ncbi:MAG: radical SAM family heme chaperone HemW [Candidatus Omnitrophota bacterium]|nr:radical SAM family heme chaperone HemW [Candidatus Omnitrophota bacterium]
MNTSLYIHIPFCRKKCGYCDFYSKPYRATLAAGYIDALCRQIRLCGDNFSSVYIGGGTPTVLPVLLLQKLLASLTNARRRAHEFTVEANPESLDRQRLRMLREYGVNRISVGVQSFCDVKLHMLGRLHSARVAREAVFACAQHGFGNIGIDLMYGVWNETLAQWQEELRQALTLPVAHISIYSLTYEKGTPLTKRLQKKKIAHIDDAVSARMYECAHEILARHGFIRYEVSNFAKRGFYSRHNMHYWRNEPSLGLGPSAASYRDGERRKNISDIRKYIERVGRGVSVAVSAERLRVQEAAKETAAVKIRTTEGVSHAWFKQKTGFDFLDLEKKELPALAREGFVRLGRSDTRLTAKGFLFSDTVSAALL